MKKRLLGILLCVLMVTTLLIGCGKEDKESADWNESSGSAAVDKDSLESIKDVNDVDKDSLEPIKDVEDKKTKELGLELVADNGDGFTYYRDRVTDGLFVCRTETNSGRGVGLSITPVPDPETGKQITYTKYLELYNAQ